jgi:hypothetical protein
MYVKSVQQFRESLAKMKIDAHRPPEGEAENEVKPQQKQHGEARVFVLWKQSFLLNKKNRDSHDRSVVAAKSTATINGFACQ